MGLLLAALHGERVNRLVEIGVMAGSSHTVLPDLPEVFEPASFANLSQTQQVCTRRAGQAAGSNALRCAALCCAVLPLLAAGTCVCAALDDAFSNELPQLGQGLCRTHPWLARSRMQMAIVFPPQNETDFKQAVCEYVASLLSMPDFMTQANALFLFPFFLFVKCTGKSTC